MASSRSSENIFEIPLSFKEQKWLSPEIDGAALQELMRKGLSDFEARIIALRGIKPNEVEALLEPKLKTQMPDPFVLMGMEQAVAAIIDAVKAKKRIIIFADYDVDGGTSAAILMSWLEFVGANASVFVPDRIIDGYGPSPELMHRIKELGADLMISVDCGAAANEALLTAHEIGLDVVVFDHHLMDGEPPLARALVNPNQTGDTSGLGNLTAAGVCFMAAAALNRAWRDLGHDASGFDVIGLLDLAALGTVCDVAPLTGFNRVIVAQGQKILARLQRLGLAKLAQVAGLKRAGNVYAAAWVLGPRLNAGGRIGDASLTVRLLTTQDEKEANEIALKLENLNAQRRAIEAGIIEEAVKLAESRMHGENDPQIIIVGSKGWHPGIIGIVAGRLKERFNRPAIVLGSIGENDDVLKGSGRSIAGVNLGELIKAALNDGILLGGGGHAMAAGLSIEYSKIDLFRSYLKDKIGEKLSNAISQTAKRIDAVVCNSAINMGLIEAKERLEPFGTGWEEPLFCVLGATITNTKIVGTNHLQVFFSDETNVKLRAICFGALGTPLGVGLQSKRPCHLILRLKRDEWRSGKEVEAEIIDAAYA